MKNYSEMSDFDINRRILSLNIVSYEDVAIHSGVKVMIGDGANWREFNPCNNPSDAWPIILENEVALNPRCAQAHLGKNDIFDEYASCWDKNPLRAAMIVYLMMKDAEK